MTGKNGKAQSFIRDYKKERKEFLNDLIYRIHVDCSSEIEKLNEINYRNSGIHVEKPKDVIKNYTGHSEKEVTNLAKRIVDNMADIDFDASYKKKLDMQLMLSDQIITHSKNAIEKLTTYKLGEFLQNIKAAITRIIHKNDFKKEEALLKIEASKNKLVKLDEELPKVTLKDLIEFDVTDSNLNEYVGKWKKHLNKIITEGRLTQLHNPTKEQIPYMEEYLKAKKTLTEVMGGNEDFSIAISSFANIVNSSIVKDALDKAEKNEIKRLNGKEGNKIVVHGLKDKEVQALKWMNDAFYNNKELSQDKIEFVQRFMKDSLGNQRLNKVLSEIIKNDKSVFEIDNTLMTRIRYFTFKTKGVKEFLVLADKLKQNWDMLQTGQDYNPEYQISLFEYGFIKDFVNAKNIFSLLNKHKLIQGNRDLEVLFNKINSTATLIEGVVKHIESELSLQPGDLAFTNSSKYYQLSHKNRTIKDIIYDFISVHSHAAKVTLTNHSENEIENNLNFKNQDNKTLAFSHINPSYIQDGEFDTYLFSDFYSLKVSNLVSKNIETFQKLEDLYGKNWMQEVDKIFKTIEIDIHSAKNNRFSNIRADDARIVKAGIADIKINGHRKSKDNDFNQIHDKILNDFYKSKEGKNINKMICSEFAAKTTIAALVALDRELKKKLGITDPNVHVIEMPFDKREKLSRMHPDRLIKILQDKGCIEKQGPTPTQKKMFRE